jgi:hypothetical protein
LFCFSPPTWGESKLFPISACETKEVE